MTITLSKDEKTWYLHATPIDGAAYEKLNEWNKEYFEFTEPGKPIYIEEMPTVASVKLLRTGKALDYTYENGVLTLPNPYAGPDGLHEVVEVRVR
ncbi:MAG: hypothetical protein AB7E95_02960 [Kiritimatiellales bacterium]